MGALLHTTYQVAIETWFRSSLLIEKATTVTDTHTHTNTQRILLFVRWKFTSADSCGGCG